MVYTAQIVTKPDCPFCVKAKEFLKGMDISYYEIEHEPSMWNKLKDYYPDIKTVPQIWITEYEDVPRSIEDMKTNNFIHVGGYDDLVEWALNE